MAYSIDEAVAKMDTENENFIIGGGSIYTQFLDHANKIYLTRVNKDYDADVYFPEFSLNVWELIECENISDDPQNDFTYSFETYVRK